MYFHNRKEHIEKIAKDERDVKRIDNLLSSFFFTSDLCSRDDTFIIKNGSRRMVRNFVLKNNKLFAPWIITQYAASEKVIGVYLAKSRTARWEIHNKLALAADLGRIPKDIEKIVVIRPQKLDDILFYINKTRSVLGVDVVFICDETEKLASSVSTLSNKEIKKVKFPYPMDERENVLRFVGEVDKDREHIVDKYTYNASRVCEYMIDDLVDKSDSYIKFIYSLPSKQSQKIINILSCGHEKESFNHWDFNVDESHKPEIIDNASYNMPFDERDVRAFSFEATKPLLRKVGKNIKLIEKMTDIIKIWKYAVSVEQNTDTIFSSDIIVIPEEEYSYAMIKETIERLESFNKLFGVDLMVDNYYDGVPLEDIIV